ncbi:MAG TPA: FAD-dependent oxidoreductase [Tepidisphaeraceae bacterium]|jgi:hypothetical protein|nr:FAD-dependent oxidoreductase [Tepidisphaeraceae bacterium]
MTTITEPSRQTPVIHDVDLCVIGGSCTGVFAAVRAARLGAKVVIVEKAGAFGGVATISLVNVWHTPLDTIYQRPIIGGLTLELVDRLKRRGAITERPNSPHWAWAFNSFDMMIELDKLVLEHGIEPMLHTSFVAPIVNGGRIDAVIVENKTGRQAIRAKTFVDATGDGDVAHRAGLPCYKAPHAQPSTTCALIENYDSLKPNDIGDLLRQHGEAFGLTQGFVWGVRIPGSQLYMMAGTRVRGLDPSDGNDMTASEIEGRRQVDGFLKMVKQHAPHADWRLVGLPARIGLRESRHVHCGHQLTGADVLNGRRFPDAIANGSYRVDIHHQERPGLTFRYLDGTEHYVVPGEPAVQSRWREPIAQDPTFYQIPYRSMLPEGLSNLLVAGRMIDADTEAHAAIRVMVNMNQTGEAAGVASVLAMRHDRDVRRVNTDDLRSTLAAGGSIMI